MSSRLIQFILICLWLQQGLSSHYAKLNTYVVGGDDNLISAGLSSAVQSQLAPVYKKNVNVVSIKPNLKKPESNRMVTKTVYGFREFTTTVGSTVMVFTPQSDQATKANKISPKKAPNPHRPFKKAVIQTSAAPKITVLASEIPVSRIPEAPKEEPTGLARLLQQALVNSQKGKQRSLSSNTGRNVQKNNIQKDGGVTLTPITIEGKGRISPKTVRLEPSIYVPEEVTVRASHRFPPISVIDRPKSNRLDFTEEKEEKTTDPMEILNISPGKSDTTVPTGLVTTLGGTIISGKVTTVHETSVVGTYVNGKYAQVLSSTTRIFKNENDHIVPTYETVKQVITGTATQFFTPKATETLPLESLFSSALSRSPRYEETPFTSESKLTKRRGSDSQPPFQQRQDEKETTIDLQRSGSELRPSFRSRYESKQSAPSRPSVFRDKFRSGGTRKNPPPFRRPSKSTPNNRRLVNKLAELAAVSPKYQRREPARRNKVQVTKITPTTISAKPFSKSDETIRVQTIRQSNQPPHIYTELITMRSLHPFKLGTITNTRYVTYTETYVKTERPAPTKLIQKINPAESATLFENILHKNKNIATLPPIELKSKSLEDMLKTLTETYRTTETMHKTSVLPVKSNGNKFYHTLVQTFYITRVVNAIKTVPPVEAFDFVPADSFNEFNGTLLAEGTENEQALLPGEQEHSENSETRLRPPSGYKNSNLADIAGGKFNPDATENPEFLAAVNNYRQKNVELDSSQVPNPVSSNKATPALSPEQLQMAYLRLYNPYVFGGIGSQQPVLTSSPVVITTDVTETSTRVLRVIFNARPISTTITTVSVVRTTITTYSTQTLAAPPGLPSFPGLPYPPPVPFPSG